MWKEIIILAYIFHLSTSDIDLLYKGNRFGLLYFSDYYISCSITGNYIQWQMNRQSLTGFRSHEVGRVTVSTRSSLGFMATLLSSSSDVNRHCCQLHSIIVISFPDEIGHNTFTIYCSNNTDRISKIISNTTIAKTNLSNSVILTNVLKLEHVLHSTTNEDNYVEVFICETLSDTQVIDISGIHVLFFQNDTIGANKTIYHNANEVYIQTVLLDLKENKITTSIMVVNDSNIRIKCNNETFPVSRNIATDTIQTELPNNATQTSLESLSLPYTTTLAKNNGNTTLIAVVVGLVLTAIIFVMIILTVLLRHLYNQNSKKRKVTIYQSDKSDDDMDMFPSYHPRGDSWVPEGELLSELAENCKLLHKKRDGPHLEKIDETKEPQPFKEVNENTEDNPEANESEVSSGQFKQQPLKEVNETAPDDDGKISVIIPEQVTDNPEANESEVSGGQFKQQPLKEVNETAPDDNKISVIIPELVTEDNPEANESEVSGGQFKQQPLKEVNETAPDDNKISVIIPELVTEDNPESEVSSSQLKPQDYKEVNETAPDDHNKISVIIPEQVTEDKPEENESGVFGGQFKSQSFKNAATGDVTIYDYDDINKSEQECVVPINTSEPEGGGEVLGNNLSGDIFTSVQNF